MGLPWVRSRLRLMIQVRCVYCCHVDQTRSPKKWIDVSFTGKISRRRSRTGIQMVSMVKKSESKRLNSLIISRL